MELSKGIGMKTKQRERERDREKEEETTRRRKNWKEGSDSMSRTQSHSDSTQDTQDKSKATRNAIEKRKRERRQNHFTSLEVLVVELGDLRLNLSLSLLSDPTGRIEGIEGIISHFLLVSEEPPSPSIISRRRRCEHASISASSTQPVILFTLLILSRLHLF